MGDRLELAHVARALKRFGLPGMLPYSVNAWQARRRRRREGGPPESSWLREEALRHYTPLDWWAWKNGPDGPRWWAHLGDKLTTAREVAGMEDYLRRRAQLEGLESRSPLMADVDLAELMLRIPPEFAFDPHFDRPLGRESMRGIVPEPVRLPQPAKSNYASLMHITLTGPDVAGLRDLVLRPDAEIRAYVQTEPLERLFQVAPASVTAGGEAGATASGRSPRRSCGCRRSTALTGVVSCHRGPAAAGAGHRCRPWVEARFARPFLVRTFSGLA